MSSTPPVSYGSTRKNKRPRAIQACEFCRAKKYKCSGTWPCQHCEKNKLDCVFEAAETNAAGLYPASYVRSLEERIERLNAAAALTQFSPASTVNRTSVRSADYAASGRNGLTTPSTREDYNNRVQGDRRDRESSDEATAEIADVNRHTQGIEFHGGTSSVAFLGSIQQKVQGGRGRGAVATPQHTSLLDTLHNPGFSPQDGLSQHENSHTSTQLDVVFFSPRAGMFLDAYFSNLHFIHPMIDKESIYRKSEALWKNGPESQRNTFLNLYLALISLGALVRTWNEVSIMGMRRFDWSRNAFRRAAMDMQKTGTRNDIETIQTYFIMAKICQNELNPSLAYIYLGLAIRLALSAGINRKPRNFDRQHAFELTLLTSRTWWALYSLEVELSFALGRPDTLGYDLYHNAPQPLVDESETAIITVMIDFARIVRSVSLDIYLSHRSPSEKLLRAFQIEKDMITWLDRLPPLIRPKLHTSENSNSALRDPVYARLQRMVLQIRYYNVTMLLMRPFIIYSSRFNRSAIDNLSLAVKQCIMAAAQTIELIHDTYLSQIFFRTWWYNTTYCLFATSIVLFALTLPPTPEFPISKLTMLIDKSIDVLEAMTECVVAQKAAEMIRTTVGQILDGNRSHAAIDYIAKSLPVSPGISAQADWYDFNDDFSFLLGSSDSGISSDATAYDGYSDMSFWPNPSSSIF